MKNSKRSRRQCRVDSCRNTLSNVSAYHVRYKVCPLHASMASVEVDGKTVRFCQRHGTFHPLDHFEDDRKTCRKQLDVHNERRKKQRAAVKGTVRPETSTASQSSCRETPEVSATGRQASAPPAPGRSEPDPLPPAAPAAVTTGQVLVGWTSGQGLPQLGTPPRALSGIAAIPLVPSDLPPGLNDLPLPGVSSDRDGIEIEVDSELGMLRNIPTNVQNKLIMNSFRLFNAHPSQLPREVYNKLWEIVVLCGGHG